MLGHRQVGYHLDPGAKARYDAEVGLRNSLALLLACGAPTGCRRPPAEAPRACPRAEERFRLPENALST